METWSEKIKMMELFDSSKSEKNQWRKNPCDICSKTTNLLDNVYVDFDSDHNVRFTVCRYCLKENNINNIAIELKDKYNLVLYTEVLRANFINSITVINPGR